MRIPRLSVSSTTTRAGGSGPSIANALLSALFAIAIVTIIVIAGGVSDADAADNAALKAGTFSPPRQAPDFSLHGSDGTELKLSRYRGKVVVLAFGFTHCPEICPTTLGVLADARKKLSASADDVQVIFVTVDAERDDAGRMRTYLASFDPTFVGGTASDAQLASIRQSYGVISEKKQSLFGGVFFAHSSFTYLIDRGGALRALMPYGRAADDYVHDVKLLLNERSAALP